MTAQMSQAAREAAVVQLAGTVRHWRGQLEAVEGQPARWARRVIEDAAEGGRSEVVSAGLAWMRSPSASWWRSPLGLLVAATGGDADAVWLDLPEAQRVSGLSRATLYRRMDGGQLEWRPRVGGRQVPLGPLAAERLAQFTPATTP